MASSNRQDISNSTTGSPGPRNSTTTSEPPLSASLAPDIVLPGSGRGRTVPHICGIYRLVDPRTGYTRYVGQSTHIANRFRNELREATKLHKTPLQRWTAKLLEAGLMPIIKIVATVPENDLDRMEMGWVAYYRTEYPLLNILDGGGQAALRNWHRGKKRPQEWKDNISAGQRKFSEDNPDARKNHAADRIIPPRACIACDETYQPTGMGQKYCLNPQCQAVIIDRRLLANKDRAIRRYEQKRKDQLQASLPHATPEMPINPDRIFAPVSCIHCNTLFIPTSAAHKFCLKEECQDARYNNILANQRHRRRQAAFEAHPEGYTTERRKEALRNRVFQPRQCTVCEETYIPTGPGQRICRKQECLETLPPKEMRRILRRLGYHEEDQG